jgi:hypothetical protein
MLSYARRRPPKHNPRKDPEKLEFVARRPCLVGRTDPEGCSGRITVHHVRLLGGKRDDRRTVPLCQGHHQDGPRAYHTLGRRFAVVHNIDLLAEADALQERYLLERAA